MARTSAGPKASGAATSSSSGTPSTVTPTARRSSCSTSATSWELGESREHGLRIRGRADHRQQLAGIAPAAHVARRLAVQRCRHAADKVERLVEEQPATRTRLGLTSQPLTICASVFQPDPLHGPEPSGRRGLAQLVRRADVQRPCDLHRALRPEPDVASEAHQVRRQLALELRQLRDTARLDELPQPRLDPRPDPAQLAHPPGADELRHPGRRGRIVSAARR